MANRSKHIEVIVRGVWRVADHFLLCRPSGGSYYYLPGGHVEPGEQSSVALAREFQEETRLHVIVGQVLAVHEQIFDDDKGVRRHEVNLIFDVTRPTWSIDERGTPSAVAAAEEDIEFSWISFNRSHTVNLLPSAVARWLASQGTIGNTCGWLT